MKQIALDIGLAPEPTLDGFLAGRNAQAVQHLRLWSESATRSPVPTYLWGPPGAGKTHLLRAARQALLAQGAAVGWLDADAPPRGAFSEQWDAVLLDDVHLYGAELQHTAFNWFVNAVAPASGRPRAVLAAGELPPADLPLREDLRTRLGWGHVFELQVLPESEMRAVLRRAADARRVPVGRGDELRAGAFLARSGQPDAVAGPPGPLCAGDAARDHDSADQVDAT